MNYESLLIEADSHQLTVKEKPLKQHDGLIFEKKIAIRNDIDTNKEKSCVLAEELGHFFTTSGNILNQDNASNQKQELRARMWAYNTQIGLSGIVDCYNHHCHSIHDMAEQLDVPHEFLYNALECYKSKYGLRVRYKEYLIMFEPSLAVMKLID